MSSRPPNSSAPRVARAATRYRPGKAPLASGGLPSDSDEDDQDGDESKVKDEAIQHFDLSSGTQALKSGKERRTAGIVLDQNQNQAAGGSRNVKQSRDVGIKLKQKEEEAESSEYGE